jgi:hypothetical protein
VPDLASGFNYNIGSLSERRVVTIPADADHVLALLSDQTDRDYPIYRDATPPDEDATLCSALYDLDNRELRIYWDHPIRKPEENIKIAL